MRKASRRSTGLPSVYYYPLSAPKHAFCFDGLARGPLRAPRTPFLLIPFSLQQPIPLYPLFPSPLPFAAILLLLPLCLLSSPRGHPSFYCLYSYPLRPTASSYSPSPPTFLLLHPSFFSLSLLLLYYYYFPSPSESSTYDNLIC